MYVLTFTIHHAGIIVVSLITSKAKNKTANEVLYSFFFFFKLYNIVLVLFYLQHEGLFKEHYSK